MFLFNYLQGCCPGSFVRLNFQMHGLSLHCLSLSSFAGILKQRLDLILRHSFFPEELCTSLHHVYTKPFLIHLYFLLLFVPPCLALRNSFLSVFIICYFSFFPRSCHLFFSHFPFHYHYSSSF